MAERHPTVTVVIPARYASSRFPGKAVVLLAGKPLIRHVYERAQGCASVERVVVATDDQRIAETVKGFGGEVIVTADPYRTGTDRVAGVARHLPGEIFVNLQGDEIVLNPDLIADLIGPFLAGRAGMGTLKRAITAEEAVRNPGVVKFVTDRSGQALYFSRAAVPHIRDRRPGGSLPGLYFVHLGLYIYTRDTLSRFAALPTGVLEDAEKLEQLRALEHGISIQVWETRHRSLRIDMPDDLKEAERVLEACPVGGRS